MGIFLLYSAFKFGLSKVTLFLGLCSYTYCNYLNPLANCVAFLTLTLLFIIGQFKEIQTEDKLRMVYYGVPKEIKTKKGSQSRQQMNNFLTCECPIFVTNKLKVYIIDLMNIVCPLLQETKLKKGSEKEKTEKFWGKVNALLLKKIIAWYFKNITKVEE